MNSRVNDSFDVIPFTDNFQGYKSSKQFVDYKNIFGEGHGAVFREPASLHDNYLLM